MDRLHSSVDLDALEEELKSVNAKVDLLKAEINSSQRFKGQTWKYGLDDFGGGVQSALRTIEEYRSRRAS
jgi:hypothetical protein